MTHQGSAEVPIERNTRLHFPGIRELSAGAVGGVCSVCVGHPFDLIKVRLQTAHNTLRLGAIESVKKSIAQDGLRRVRTWMVE